MGVGRTRRGKEVNFAKIFNGLLILGFGVILFTVFPKKSISLTKPIVPQETVFLEPNPAVAQELYEQWLKQEELKTKKQKGNFDPCSCVSYAKWKSGINVGSIGAAKNHPINSQTPTVGGLIVTKESKDGHLAVVAQIWANMIVIDEYNYAECAHTTREISRNSPLIVGYYY